MDGVLDSGTSSLGSSPTTARNVNPLTVGNDILVHP